MLFGHLALSPLVFYKVALLLAAAIVLGALAPRALVATRAVCEGLDDARRLLLAPVVAAAGAAVYALVQVAGSDPTLYVRVAGHGGLVRPFATLGHPNFLAAYLVMALPLIVYALARALGHRHRLAAGALTIVAVAAGTAVAVAVSRGAWLALAAAAWRGGEDRLLIVACCPSSPTMAREALRALGVS